MKILIIEDEVLLADSLKTLLEAKGFEAEAVYSGESGAEYAQLGVYDLLILDVMMPGLNGFQVARQVRSSRCGTPILMLTARSDVLDRVEGLNSGADSPSPLTRGSCWPASTPCCAARGSRSTPSPLAIPSWSWTPTCSSAGRTGCGCRRGSSTSCAS